MTALDVATAQLLRELPDDDLAELRDAYRELLDGCDAEILRRLLAKHDAGEDAGPGSGSGVSS